MFANPTLLTCQGLGQDCPCGMTHNLSNMERRPWLNQLLIRPCYSSYLFFPVEMEVGHVTDQRWRVHTLAREQRWRSNSGSTRERRERCWRTLVDFTAVNRAKAEFERKWSFSRPLFCGFVHEDFSWRRMIWSVWDVGGRTEIGHVSLTMWRRCWSMASLNVQLHAAPPPLPYRPATQLGCRRWSSGLRLMICAVTSHRSPANPPPVICHAMPHWSSREGRGCEVWFSQEIRWVIEANQKLVKSGAFFSTLIVDVSCHLDNPGLILRHAAKRD